MKFRTAARRLTLVLMVLLLVAVAVLLVLPRGSDEMPPSAVDLDTSRHGVIAVFGATGTVGDGLLKAVMNDPCVRKIHVVTRRSAPRIEDGVASGLVEATTHMDYLDFTSLREILAQIDAVYWAIGTSTRNVSKEEYGLIHVDFPAALVKEWMGAREEGDLSFHYVSGSGAKSDSAWHWAREKARAENVLFDLAEGTHLRVVSYRPGAVLHSTERAGFGDSVMKFVFEPFGLTVSSTAVGQAMLEVSARGDEIGNGTVLENRDILTYRNGYLAARENESALCETDR